MGLSKKKTHATLATYINRGIYIILRRTPVIHLAFGLDSLFDLKMTQFQWVLNHWNKENTPPKEDKMGAKMNGKDILPKSFREKLNKKNG